MAIISPVQIPLLVVAVCLLVVPRADAQPKEPPAAKAALLADVATARDALREHPKFKKFYDHLAANPDSLAKNGPKLAALLDAEVRATAAIRDHVPSQLAAWQEIARLATAGNDYKLALPALDSLQKHASGILAPTVARQEKGKLLLIAADANAAKPMSAEREALLQELRTLLQEAIADNDVEALPFILAADREFSWSTAESWNSTQLLLPLTDRVIRQEQAAAARLLLSHLDALVAKTAAGKQRKEASEAVVANRKRLTIIEKSQQAQQTLSTKPLDPAANQAMGEYLLMHRGKCRESLTYLALGSDPASKALAAETLENKTSAEKAALADRWVAIKSDDPQFGREIARHLYQEVLADKSFLGIQRAAVDAKTRELGPASVAAAPTSASNGATTTMPAATISDPNAKPLPRNKWVKVLPLVDFDQDPVIGYWEMGEANTIKIAPSGAARMRLPLLLANCSYDLSVQFQFRNGDHKRTHLILPVGNRNVGLVVDGFADTKTTNFDRIEPKDAAPPPEAIRRELLKPDSLNTYEVAVRLQGDRAKLTFTLNGEKLIEHEGPISALSVAEASDIGTLAQPAFVCADVYVTLLDCQVRVVEGEGSIGRVVPLIKPLPANVLALKATSLTTMQPLSKEIAQNIFRVNSIPSWGRAPLVGGRACNDFILIHAPAKLTYAIPPKSKYFTAVANAYRTADVKFIVRADGKELFTSERRSLDTVLVELPEGAKELELECDPLQSAKYDHSYWCFPAFR